MQELKSLENEIVELAIKIITGAIWLKEQFRNRRDTNQHTRKLVGENYCWYSQLYQC